MCALYITLYSVLYSECPSLENNAWKMIFYVIVWLTIFVGEQFNRDADVAATGIEEGRSVTNRTSRLTDVVRTCNVAVTTQVVDGTKEPALARVGVARVRHQGDLILRRLTGLCKNTVTNSVTKNRNSSMFGNSSIFSNWLVNWERERQFPLEEAGVMMSQMAVVE